MNYTMGNKVKDATVIVKSLKFFPENYFPNKLHDKEEMLLCLEGGVKLGHKVFLKYNFVQLFQRVLCIPNKSYFKEHFF